MKLKEAWPDQIMKLHLADYQLDACVDVRGEYNPKTLELEFVDFKYLGEIEMEGTVERGQDTLTFQGHLFSKTEHLCGRCLKVVTGKMNQPFQFFYETKGLDEIDTTDDLRELLVLNHPLTFVCSEECKGLCAGCGVNLNEASCRCKPGKETAAESPFRVMLNKIKEDKKNGTS